MPSERVQRQIDRLLDQAEAAISSGDWGTARQHAASVLALDESNVDAQDYLAAADKALRADHAPPPNQPAQSPAAVLSPQPTSFANGRYVVSRFLGEGGKKKVYLAHDALLDRDVAFALIKTEGLDDAGRVRIQREAQAMGRLGNHPNIVTVYDIGDEAGQPYLVLPILSGGDVEGVIERAPEHKLPLDQALKIAIETCQGLELAHSKGIVHRDLKPGNVWLTEDGRAMIGDFGLAVAADRSRLTQAGMMVGTVSYMPPEQAMGGEVGPRSDLYSLGAMLYEMVCGRPPFVGDESVAIIGQHLNTPPVAPIWHRPDCPPALETLILRLLEKDPSKRPASATEVREALESVSPGRVQAPRDPSIAAAAPSGGDNPLYRRTFVGRENEVRQLQQAFDAALSGQGGLVMVVGEPGIGKTAICEQLATYVALRGGKAIVGHCYEEGSLSLPYLAFVEAMRTYVLAREPDGLRTDLGTGAADVARIVSEVRDRVQGVELRTAGDPEDDRWRLLQSVTSFLRNASTVQPLCIVLEDLHWADRGTLDLLLHVSRNLTGARLLIVGTYRDVEVDRSHPLSGVLADLRRGANFARVPLRGLTVDEVHRMYEALRGQATPWAQAEAVHRQTEGNPLFIQEVIRYLVEEGFVVRQGGHWVLAVGTQPGTGLPEGLRDVVGKRLSRLSESCNRLLSVAAVIGRDFDLQTLRGVAALSEEDLLSGIEEAVRVGVLEERSLPGSLHYRFAHAFFRTALYEEMIAARRLRLHQEVARALETQYASRREEHAAELAEHYGQSTDRADLAKAVEYSELAARRAMSVFAYAEAEEHLKRCLAVQDVLDPDDKARRCDLLLELGAAILPQERPDRVIEQATSDAFDLAVGLGEDRKAARAAVMACDALANSALGTNFGTEANATWSRRALDYAPIGTPERVYANSYHGMSVLGHGLVAQGHEFLRSAMKEAIAIGDSRAFFAASRFCVGALRALKDRELRQQAADEVIARPHEGIRSQDMVTSLINTGRIQLASGNRIAMDACWREARELAEHAADVSLGMYVRSRLVQVPYLDGNLDECARLIEELDSEAKDKGANDQPSATYLAVKLSLGKDVEAAMSRFEGPQRTTRAHRALALAKVGQTNEALAILRTFSGLASDDDESSEGILSDLLQVSVLTRDLEAATWLLRRLAPSAHLLSEGMTQSGAECSYGRILGEAAAVLGQPQDARRFYAQALELCEKVHFRPEIALIRLDLAELLLEYYPDERDAAIEHLDFAVAELRDMKMQPALERALRHRGLLKA